MSPRIPIRYKLALAISVLIVPLLILLSMLFYWQFQKAIDERVLLQLSSIKQLKSVQIEDYLKREWALFEKAVESRIQRGDLVESTQGQINFLKEKQLAVGPDTMWLDIIRSKEKGIFDLSQYSTSGKILLGMCYQVDSLTFGLQLINAEKIQEILLERTGMGETGETYLVGSDFRLRSLSRFFPDKVPSEIVAQTRGVELALMGQEGIALINDYRNVPVFSAFGRVDHKSINWAILSELDVSEVYRPLIAMRNRLILILFFITVFTVLGAFLLSRQLVKPLVKMKRHLSDMASGNYLDNQIVIQRNDEIGDMFNALDHLIKSIRQTIYFADEIGTMNLDAQYQMLGENDRLGRSLLSMREKLKALKAKEEKLQLATEKSLLQGQEKERQRLSREMHDGLGPLLTSLKVMVQRMSLETNEKENIKTILDDTIAEVRRMTYNLMPQALVDFGVAQALENLVALTTKVTGISFKYTHSMSKDDRLDDEINVGLYRIAQEAINNSLKHSGSSEIRMSLTQFDDRISFYFSDNGTGFNPDAQYAGAGLVNIRERCRILNGQFNLESDSQGTTIEIEIPTKHE